MSVISMTAYRTKRVLESPEALIRLMDFTFPDSFLEAEEELQPLHNPRVAENLVQYLAAFGFEHFQEEASTERMRTLCMVLKKHFAPMVQHYLIDMGFFHPMSLHQGPASTAYAIAVATQDKPRIKELRYIAETYFEGYQALNSP